ADRVGHGLAVLRRAARQPPLPSVGALLKQETAAAVEDDGGHAGTNSERAFEVTLERDHPFNLPDPAGVRNALRPRGAEEPLELGPRLRRDRGHAGVLLDVRSRLHPHEGGADPRRRADELLEREVAGRARVLAVPVPGGRPVASQLALADRLLERVERGADALAELRPVHFLELRLRIVDVVDVERLEPQVGAAPLDLVREVAGRDAVDAAHYVARADDARVEVRLREPGARIAGHGAVERDVAPLRRHDDLVPPREPAAERGGERRADRALAALVPVVHGRVDRVDAELERARERVLISDVR